MINFTIKGKIVTPDKVVDNAAILIRNGKIERLLTGFQGKADYDFGDAFITPGFINLHIHGLADGNSKTSSGVQKMAGFAPKTGMTGFLPTLASVPPDVYKDMLKSVSQYAPEPRTSKILGVHMEGPYIVPARRGGMDIEYTWEPHIDEIESFFASAGGALKLMTLSPEIRGAEWLIPLLRKNGCVVSAGHTDCPIPEFKDKVPHGIELVCHLYDTFTPASVDNGVMQPSLADEILVDDRLSVELIPDGIHVPPTLLELARRILCPDRFVAITDSLEGAGWPDGIHKMPDGREYSLRKGDVCRLTDEAKTIVGSSLTMNEAFANLLNRFNFSVIDAVKALSSNPARVLSLEKRLGKIQEGFDADICAITGSGEVLATWINGETACEINDA